ncbi:MAG: hypothetical protein OEV42_12070 [Deltaproteobacteria bacterium]|nr:hypothetical protein [Deltaproteobacteria bacterium]
MSKFGKFRHRLGIFTLLAALLSMALSFFFSIKGFHYPLVLFQPVIFAALYVTVLKLYRSKKKRILEGEKKRYDILDGYIMKIKESAEYGINLIPVLIKALEGVVAQSEDAALTIGNNFGKIIKSSKDGAEEADAVVDYLLGRNEGGESDFGPSYLKGILDENKNSLKTALQDLEKLSAANEKFLKEFSNISDGFLVETHNNLTHSISNVTDSVNVLSRMYNDISDEIGAVIISLQFQDITKQKVEHVIAPLLKLREKLERVSRIATIGDKLINEWEAKDLVIGDLDEMYTMEAERRVMNEVLRQNAEEKERAESKKAGEEKAEEEVVEKKDSDLDDNVELF